MQILNGELQRSDMTKSAMGGSELMSLELINRVPKELLDKFQIIVSRQTHELLPDKKKIVILHDLPGDPSADFLKNGGYNSFDKIVFVSNWQMQAFIHMYGIPWYKCVVLQNAIVPIPEHSKPMDKIRLIYHTTPHRGLNILFSVFEHLAKKYDNIELDVFSSFKIYGWEQRDAEFRELFDSISSHKKANYHGTVSNEEIRKHLAQAHIFSYPNTWLETSCISLIEAMSAGCLCVHPNYGALSETAANWTWMYQFQQNLRDHANVFYNMLDQAIQAIQNNSIENRLHNQKQYIDMFYNWDLRALEWQQLLESIAGES